jgi:hypothetical protein
VHQQLEQQNAASEKQSTWCIIFLALCINNQSNINAASEKQSA